MALATAQVAGTGTTSGGAGGTASFGSSTTSGSLIVVVGHVFDFGTGYTPAAGHVTDSKSNTYVLRKTISAGGTSTAVGIWEQLGGTRGASHTVTYTPGGVSDSNVAIIEITGADASAPYDSTTAASASDGTSPYDVTAAASISGNQIAIYGVTIDTGTNTAWTQPTGYTNIFNIANGVTSLVSLAAYKINETGTPTVGASSSHSPASGREVLVTYKEAAGGPAFLARPATDVLQAVKRAGYY